MPSFIATPLSFGLAYGLTGGDDEAKVNIIIDSEVINRTNELLNILEEQKRQRFEDEFGTADNYETLIGAATFSPTEQDMPIESI